MINRETADDKVVTNVNDFFKHTDGSSAGTLKGFDSNHRKPTTATILGKELKLSVSFGDKSNGLMVNDPEFHDLYGNRSKAEYFHPNAFGSGELENPVLTIYIQPVTK